MTVYSIEIFRVLSIARAICANDATVAPRLLTVPFDKRGATVVRTPTSPAYLVLNDNGEVGVRTIVDKNLVQFKPVDIVGDGSDGMWITGLPPRETVVTVGHQFVRHGQRVIIDPQGGAS